MNRNTLMGTWPSFAFQMNSSKAKQIKEKQGKKIGKKYDKWTWDIITKNPI